MTEHMFRPHHFLALTLLAGTFTFAQTAAPPRVFLLDANMLASDAAELALKVDNLERELMADGPGG